MACRSSKAANPRVLLLQENPTAQSKLAQGLRESNYEVSLASTGQQVLEQCRKGKVDVLVVDFNLNVRKLREGLVRLVTERQNSRILVIARSLEHLALAGEIGVHAVLLKPIDLNKIKTVLSTLVLGLKTTAPEEQVPCADGASLGRAPVFLPGNSIIE